MKDYIHTTLLIDCLELPARFTQREIDEVFVPLLRELTARQKELGRRLIVFLGASIGCGKSFTLAYLERLSREIPGVTPIQAVGLDGFHFPNSYLDSHEVTVAGVTHNMRSIKGWPETFHADKVYEKLDAIRKGEQVLCPIYDRATHDPTEDKLPVTEQIVMFEGLWMMYDKEKWERVQTLADYRIMLLAPLSLSRKRAVARKVRNGMTEEDSIAFFNRSDCAATRRIVTNMAQADEYWETQEDDEILRLPGRPTDLSRYIEG